MAAAIEASESLTHLNLTANSIGDVGASRLAAAIRKSPSLVELNLESNDITDQGAKELLAAMRESLSLRQLSLRSNCIRDDSLLTIHERTPQLQEPAHHPLNTCTQVRFFGPRPADEISASAWALQERHEHNRPKSSLRGSDGQRPGSRTPSVPSEAGSSVSRVSSRVSFASQVSSRLSSQVSSQTGYSDRTPCGTDHAGGSYDEHPEARRRSSSRHRRASQERYREPNICDQLSDYSRSTGASTSKSSVSARTASSRFSTQTGSAAFNAFYPQQEYSRPSRR